MADASWKEGNFSGGSSRDYLYNIEVETANLPIMNQYAGSFHTRGRRRETNNPVCVALPCLVTLPGYLEPCVVTLPG